MSSVFDENVFDRLPDHIALLIFNKVHDAKSLVLSMSVCKRFHSIIPEIDTVFLSIPCQNPIAKNSHEQRKVPFKNLVSKVLVKPFKYLLQLLKSKSGRSCVCEHEYYSHMPYDALKPFRDVQHLELKLPRSISEIHSNFLKWKAEFGSKFQSCTLLCASEISSTDESVEVFSNHESRNGSGNNELLSESSQENSRISDEGLNLRIIWTVSCLIAASARHYLVQQTLNDHQTLDSLRITDETNQGTLCMNREQLEEFRKSNQDAAIVEEKTGLYSIKMPELRMKMWYVPELKLPASGRVMKGATLVVIKPVEEENVEESEDSLLEAFDGVGEEKVFGEAVRKLLKKKNRYTLKINPF